MVKQFDTPANSFPRSHVDTNQNEFCLTVNSDESKNNSEPPIIDSEDNWIAKFLYGGPIGYTVNFTLLITITAAFVISLRYMFNDEESYQTIIEPLWLPSVMQFFLLVIPMNIIMCIFIVLFVYPLSRLSRCTVYYWFLGLTFSAILFAFIWPVREYSNIGSRILLMLEWGHLSMKIAAFLIECSWSEQVFKKSSMKSLFYFLWIPTLVYKPQYPVARRIRWVKVLCHIWWILGPGFALLLFCYKFIFPFVRIDLLTVEFSTLVLLGFAGVMMLSAYYPVLAWFILFENFCGLHGELLRYPYLRMFGEVSDILAGNDVLKNCNTNVSDWMSRYIYIPVVKSGGTRTRAMYFVISLSAAAHDFGYFYIGDIIIIYSLVLNMVLVPSYLSLQPKKTLYRVLMSIFFTPILLFWMGSYCLEFIAWNYSSMPHVDQLSRIRLVPLYLTQLYQNFFSTSM